MSKLVLFINKLRKMHSHPFSDEFFIVIEGKLEIDFENQPTVILHPNQAFCVKAGVIHRTRALIRTVNLCFEHTNAETVFHENLELGHLGPISY